MGAAHPTRREMRNLMMTKKCFTIIYNNGDINEYEEEEEEEIYFASKEEAIAYLKSQEREETANNGKEDIKFIYRFVDEDEMLRCYSPIPVNYYGWEPSEDTCITVDGVKYCCNNNEFEYIMETTITLSDTL